MQDLSINIFTVHTQLIKCLIGIYWRIANSGFVCLISVCIHVF